MSIPVESGEAPERAASTSSPCSCPRKVGRFRNATLVVKPDGVPVLLVGGLALAMGKVQILDDDPNRAPRVVVEVPLAHVDVISWNELVERRERPAGGQS